MKKHHLIILFLCTLALIGCGPGPDPVPRDEIAVFKFNQEWTNGVIVPPIILSEDRDADYNTVLTYGDSLALPNTYSWRELADFAWEELHLIDYPPYILLDKGYAIVSWRWRYFVPFAAPCVMPAELMPWPFSYNWYLNNGFITNKEFYYIQTNYKDWNDLHQVWAFSEGERIDLPELRYTNLEKLDKYRQKKGSYKKDARLSLYIDGLDVSECYKLFQSDARQAAEYAQMCDSLELVYVAALNKMIQNNELEKWTVKR